jgi:hypothetical protein
MELNLWFKKLILYFRKLFLDFVGGGSSFFEDYLKGLVFGGG